MNFKPVSYLFLKLNLWLCLTSVLMVVATAMALSIPISNVGIGMALPALLFYFIYTEDRRDPSPEDHINQPYRTHLVEKYGTALLATEITALLTYEFIIAGLVHTNPGVGLEYLLFAQLPLIVLVVYDQLKQYPTFDSLAVGSTWSFVIVFSVIITATPPLSFDILIVFTTWLVIVFAGVESRNIQDIEGDTETSKTTLAGYLGAQNTQYMNLILKGLAVIVFGVTSSLLTAVIVTVYLLLLQLFRMLTERADKAINTEKASTNLDGALQ